MFNYDGNNLYRSMFQIYKKSAEQYGRLSMKEYKDSDNTEPVIILDNVGKILSHLSASGN